MRWRSRLLHAVQVEVTSRCSRRCSVCPRWALADCWREGDISEALWRRLIPDLALADHVHLQGWGEPLLHPKLPQMVRDAHAAGCRVGLTTNGDLLGEASSWMVEEAVDLVTVSVAGDVASHPEMRDGSGLRRLWELINALKATRGRRRRPRLQVSYLLTWKNAPHLPTVVKEAAASGADELFVSHLDCTPSKRLLGLAAFSEGGLRSGMSGFLADAERTAREVGLAYRPPALEPQSLLTCALNPLRLVFVGWDGRVFPCVNLGLPVSGSIPRWHGPSEDRVAPLVYGDLASQSLSDLLKAPTYRRFTAPLVERLAAEKRFLSGLGGAFGSEAIEQLDRADRARDQALAAATFPAECRGCHKQWGW